MIRTPLMSALTAAITLSIGNLAVASADIIITNALLYTDKPAEALAIEDGKISYIGSSQGAYQHQGRNTEVIDMEGAFVLPGFIDNHNHVFEAASEAGGACELGMDASLEQQTPYLEYCRSYNSNQGWLMGYGFLLDRVLNEDSRRTPLQVIDEVFPDQPVVLMEQTSHSMWVNSAALKKAGITKNTPHPPGGRILKDPYSGELNGILLDNAGDMVMEQAWNSLRNKFDKSYQGLMNGLSEAAMHGITTIGDGRLYWKRGWYDVWKEAERNGDITARVSLRPWIYPEDSMKPQLKFLQKIHSTDLSKRLIVDQVKMYSDGIVTNGTAKLLAPYRDTYLEDAPYGINYIPPKAMTRWLTTLNQIGYGAHIHAIGDGAVRESLNAIESVRQQDSKHAYTLTHVEMVHIADVKRFKALDVTADFQVAPDYSGQEAHDWAHPFLGKSRLHQLMQIMPIYNSGANVSLSSDWNVNSINPLVGIASSLNSSATSFPSVEAAIDAYTINAAISLGLEEITGSIEVGKSADLAVLENDITQLSPSQIAKTPILMTILQGEIVFDAEDNQGI